MNFTYRNFVVAYLAWWAIWLVIQTSAVLLLTDLATEFALAQSFFYCLTFALAGLAMVNLQRYYRPRFVILLVWSLVIAIIATYAGFELVRLWVDKPEAQELLKSTVVLQFILAWLTVSFCGLLSWLWLYTHELRQNEVRKQDLEKLAREAELSTLRLQLQPHFLFNSLNSISALVSIDPPKAQDMIQHLSEFLRGTIRREETGMLTLEEELRHLQLYLEIEKVRFGHRLQTRLNLEPQVERLKLPPLLLQPVVENAIKFGLYHTLDEVCIALDASSDQGQLIIQVSNPYDPEVNTSRPGTGFGLASIRRRLFLVFGRNDLVVTHAQEGIFTTRIKIPQLS